MAREASERTATPPFTIHGHEVPPGQSRYVELPLPHLYNHTQITMPVQVLHGRRKGPRLLLCAAIHGDELNGVEIIRRTLGRLNPAELKGTVVAVPIVNVFGFLTQSRYLPDRRDLNRCFPGAKDGSLASRLAHLYMTEIVARCTHGIDLHTAAQDRTNLPQIRADLEDEETSRCAKAFGAPIRIHASTRDGSLREAAVEAGVRFLLYEGGEPLRFNEEAIQIGVEGTLRVLAALKMRKQRPRPRNYAKRQIESTRWIRARQSGILRLSAGLGDTAKRGQILGTISDPIGERISNVRAPAAGIVIGHTVNPLVHRGDAAVHLGVLPPE